jgi:hypothetical protein
MAFTAGAVAVVVEQRSRPLQPVLLVEQVALAEARAVAAAWA